MGTPADVTDSKSITRQMIRYNIIKQWKKMVIQPHNVDVNNSSYKESRISLQNMLRKTSLYCFLVMARNETNLTSDIYKTTSSPNC